MYAGIGVKSSNWMYKYWMERPRAGMAECCAGARKIKIIFQIEFLEFLWWINWSFCQGIGFMHGGVWTCPTHLTSGLGGTKKEKKIKFSRGLERSGPLLVIGNFTLKLRIFILFRAGGSYNLSLAGHSSRIIGAEPSIQFLSWSLSVLPEM